MKLIHRVHRTSRKLPLVWSESDGLFPRSLAPQALAPAASGDSLDWKDYDAATITQRVTSKVSPGSIVLFHNAALHTPEALPSILEYLLQEGYQVVPVSQLILPGTYGEDFIIDHTGRQLPNP